MADHREIARLRGEVLDLRLKVHSLEGENGELRRRLRVQSVEMERAKRAAYDAYMATMTVMAQRFE